MNQITSINPSVPYIPEAEQYVLGALLLFPDNLGLVAGSGGVKLFHDPTHAELYRQMVERDKADLIVSPVALAEWARQHEGMSQLGGAKYLVNMAGIAPTPDMLPHHVEILQEIAEKRRLSEVLSEAVAAVARGEESTTAIAGRVEAALALTEAPGRKHPVSMMKAVTKAVEDTHAAYTGEGDPAVISGLPALDRMFTGFYPGELTLLGGRPSMGKTAVALSIGLNVARAGHGVAICSLEMNPEAMALRAISEATVKHRNAVQYSSMRRGDMSVGQFETFKDAAREVSELPITFLPRDYSDIGALVGGAKQAKRMLGDDLKLLIIDYAQLLRAKANSRFEEITKISIALKSLAGSLDVPVLALSQLSRGVESREDKRPMMSDLRESGQLEQDADAIMFCYRDEYYLEREKPDAHDEEKFEAWTNAMRAAHNKLEIIVAKQRQGAVGTAHMFCNPALNAIWEG